MPATMAPTDYQANIMAAFLTSSEGQRLRGRAWYRRMTACMQAYADRGMVPDAASAGGVYASFSINTQWKTNIRLARKFLRGGTVRTMGGNIAKATACKSGIPLTDVVKDANALKIRSFACNMGGCRDCVTVDRHAHNVATNGARTYVPKGDEYRTIADAYRTVAAIVGETPADLQAIAWVALRDSLKGKGKGKGKAA